MGGPDTFSTEQISLTRRILSQTEDQVGAFYQIHFRDLKKIHYDIRTSAQLDTGERSSHAVAQICKYECSRPGRGSGNLFDFYRICMQDRNLLSLTRMSGNPIEIIPLLLYVLTHEFVHIIRFSLMGQDFFASSTDREMEEERVHLITMQVLRESGHGALSRVYDYFDRSRIGRRGAGPGPFMPIRSCGGQRDMNPGRIRAIDSR